VTWFYAALVAIAVVDLELLAVALLVRRGVKQMMQGGLPGLTTTTSSAFGVTGNPPPLDWTRP